MGELTERALNQKENLRLLRRYLGISQKEFISRFLSDDSGKALISIATYSNTENKGGVRLNEIILAVSEKLSLDSMIFSLDPAVFAERIELLVTDSEELEQLRETVGKKGNIDHLINRLTMYFAEKMFDKTLKKGDKIPSDRMLAKELQVSRSAIREALKVLDVLGMINIHPGQGTYISSEGNNFFIIPLSWSLFLNGNQMESIIEVRNLLEIKAAELAAECQDLKLLSDFSEVSENIRKAYQEKDYKSFLDRDMEFHTCIAECSGNKVIYSMIQTIRNLMRRVSETGMVDEEQLHQIFEEHLRIYGFILAKQPVEAGEAMRTHLSNSKKRYNYR